jgi:hypothetical protein
MRGKQMTETELAQFQKRFQAALKNERLFAESARREPVVKRTPPSLNDLKVRWVQMANFANSARKAVRENPVMFIALFGFSIAAGALVAVIKRRPQRWSELRL